MFHQWMKSYSWSRQRKAEGESCSNQLQTMDQSWLHKATPIASWQKRQSRVNKTTWFQIVVSSHTTLRTAAGNCMESRLFQARSAANRVNERICIWHIKSLQHKGPLPVWIKRSNTEKLRALLVSLEKPSGSCSLVMVKPISQWLQTSHSCIHDSWVIDFGAINHITLSTAHFITYCSCPSTRKSVIADGSLTIMTGVGHIHFGPFLLLKNVLLCFEIIHYLVPIQKIAWDMNCNVIMFYSSHFIF